VTPDPPGHPRADFQSRQQRLRTSASRREPSGGGHQPGRIEQ
jgi:hypothetical protein